MVKNLKKEADQRIDLGESDLSSQTKCDMKSTIIQNWRKETHNYA